MFNHKPDDYVCPFCRLAAGEDGEQHTKQADIFFENEHTMAFIAPKWWLNNAGAVLVIPKQHAENIYDIDDASLSEVYKTVKRVAIAIRSTYDCQGTSTRQHNEPAGNQNAWHFHVHVFPRYDGDELYQNHDNKRYTTPEERAPYAEKLRQFFANVVD